ncbi:30S ribosomal protein S6 [Desulfonauticus submarinus]|uniref:Small ribosomal subunit protein bS6 n=1 Tax=Desulfonauticus submarinus TaxID=206665 RepID=A0A1G9ZGG6_9BACT|nr:30S ribosomal protein S6 [Desulfonauticus submarinus]SDN20344.1 small subunit ribosomal protein S6 [Desulfonauticus submarinus]
MLRRYETLLLLSPELSSEEKQGVVEKVSDIIKRDGGEVVLVDDWGMKELAYPVRKQTRGYYVRLEFGLPGKYVSELERNLRIMEEVFRFVTVKLADSFESKEEKNEQ